MVTLLSKQEMTMVNVGNFPPVPGACAAIKTDKQIDTIISNKETHK